MSIDSTHNNLSTSFSINITSQSQNIAGSLGRRNPEDYYKFNLSSSSSLTLSLDGLSFDADMQLLNSSGTAIAGSHSRYNTAEFINMTLDAGTYYIYIARVGSASTSYNLHAFQNEAPQSLQFSTNKSSYQVGETVSLTNTRVFDGNGANDVTRVDFWLQKDSGNWQDISDATQFTVDSNDNRYCNFSYALTNLASGSYQLSAKAYDKSGATTNIVQTSFNIIPGTDWFDQNIQDAVIRATSRSYFADNLLDRNDMVAILRDAKDGGVVDSTELTDLRTLVGNTSFIQIPEYVRVLSNKIVNSDPANQKYQGNTLGNLAEGSTDIQIERLINKWFFGGDRPQTSYTYQYASGSLFQNGINYQDVKQGEINDCFFLTGLATTAARSPSTIESMFIDNGDNTFTVRFWHNGVADYVTVDRYLPTNSSGNFVYASKNNHYNNSGNELWVALAEKAYAQVNESGWIYQDNTNTYQGISHGGYISDAFAHITGYKTAFAKRLDYNAFVSAFDSGRFIGLASKLTGVASNVVAGHAYALINYNPSSQKFTLFNPWGIDNNYLQPGILELSWSEIETSFDYWDCTINNVIST